MAERYIIIGSSAASLACALHLKRLNAFADITMLTAQSEKPNNTCFLAEYVAGNRAKDQLYLPVPNIKIIYNTEVVHIDKGAKQVFMQDGTEYSYDKLFIGTGLQAHVPLQFLSDLNKTVFLFKSLDDMVKFEKLEHSFKNKKILIIGAGITGVEGAAALVQRGYNVTLYEKNAHILPQCKDLRIISEVTALLRNNGVNILCGDTNPAHIERDEGLADLIFVAAGGKPATGFLNNQLELENGFIKTNEFQQTSDMNIFAGGDVCVGRTLWPQALQDGKIAAHNMVTYNTQPSFAINHPVVIKIFGKIVRIY